MRWTSRFIRTAGPCICKPTRRWPTLQQGRALRVKSFVFQPRLLISAKRRLSRQVSNWALISPRPSPAINRTSPGQPVVNVIPALFDAEASRKPALPTRRPPFNAAHDASMSTQSPADTVSMGKRRRCASRTSPRTSLIMSGVTTGIGDAPVALP